MKTAIRMDDITPDMDFEKFYRVKKMLDTYQIKPLIGVVPYNQDFNLKKNPVLEDFSGFLKLLQSEGYEIALHGCYHVYTTSKKGMFPLNDFSEYAGVSYEKQDEMIRKGKARLQEWGIETDIFMAPAHTYDKNTLKALAANGFKRITDGFGTKPYIRSGLTFYPIAAKRSECFSDKEGYTTLVLHANMMEEKDFQRLEQQLKENKGKFIPYSGYLNVDAKKRGMMGNLVEYITAMAKYVLVRVRES